MHASIFGFIAGKKAQHVFTAHHALFRCPPFSLLGLSVNKADGFQCSSSLKHAAMSSRKPFLGTVEKDPMPARDSRSRPSKPYFMVKR